jgi:threonylcarbamoyladenosine tRNA methylthiotransferase MtaB
MISFYSYSFGCRVNEAEKQSFDAKLISLGINYSNVDPDFIIINTCAVTQKAEREARQLIYSLKRKNPKSKIIIAGCAATYWKKNKLYESLPVDLIVDNKEKEHIVETFYRNAKNTRGHIRASRNTNNLPANKYLNSGRLLLKIQDGCHRFCSYCIVPYLRGKPKSVHISEIIQTINSNKQNIQEIILTAINTEAFGYDTKENIVQLIQDIINQTKVKRISFGSIHPLTLTNEFISFYKNKNVQNRFVHFFHIPIQSGSKSILQLMNRGYTAQEIDARLKTIQSINPFAFFATDVITGFLGEGKQEFEETYEFLKKTPFSKFHVFRFSLRNNTAAEKMAKQWREPDEGEKIKRSEILRDLSNKKYLKFIKINIGQISPALFLEKQLNGFQLALLDNQLSILLKTSKNLKGSIRNVRIEKLEKSILFGSLDG